MSLRAKFYRESPILRNRGRHGLRIRGEPLREKPSRGTARAMPRTLWLPTSQATPGLPSTTARPLYRTGAAPVCIGPPATTISTRRLRARPSAVVLSATGRDEPKPATSVDEAATPWFIR